MKGLRIGWASPWNERSAIAQSASEVAFELSRRGHVITVLRTEVDEALTLPPRASPGPINALANFLPHQLRQDFDVVVAHIGDHYGFHGALLSRLPDVDVVGIFHDVFLADLAWMLLDGNEAAIRALRQTYGEDTWPVGEPFFNDPREVMRQRPMLEWLARQTVGAVAHAEHYAQRLRDACSGPVAVIPLAFTTPDLPPPPVPWNRLTIGVVGHANANKRIDQLIMAIGASPILRSCCRIRIMGEASPDERERLRWLARTARIGAPEFTGWVSNEELRWQLRDVDVMSCLRNPILEGSSAALVLAQSSGRPTLVTGHGSYAEVPANTVLACSPEHEARDVTGHLERWLADPTPGVALGQRARAYALRRHAPEAYADALLILLKEVVARRPELRARRQLESTLIDFGLPANDPAVNRVEAILASLLTSIRKNLQ
jgi:glycosyltransferase involved in cell wall biosynthesis